MRFKVRVVFVMQLHRLTIHIKVNYVARLFFVLSILVLG
jgi:hypothetical protein